MPMTEAGINYGVLRDIYVAMGEEIEPQVWTIRLFYKPFIDWLWFAAALMALGGALAASDRRYRIALKDKAAA
jgi:cytochrome c-type biogenesis protein CcmF